MLGSVTTSGYWKTAIEGRDFFPEILPAGLKNQSGLSHAPGLSLGSGRETANARMQAVKTSYEGEPPLECIHGIQMIEAFVLIRRSTRLHSAHPSALSQFGD